MGQLNRWNLTDANRSFNRMLKSTDESGVTLITKRDEIKYAVITKDIYDRIKEDIMREVVITDKDVNTVKNVEWLRHQDGSVCRLWLSNDTLKVVKLDTEDGMLTGYTFFRIPYDNVEITEGNPAKVKVFSEREVKFKAKDLLYPVDKDDLDEYAEYKMVEDIYKASENAEAIPAVFEGHRLLA